MLKINDLTVSYGKTAILENLQLETETGQIHGIVGMNGSGKTTLLNTIFGFIRPDRGTVTMQGKPLFNDRIAFLETNNYFYSKITGNEYLQFFQHHNPDFDTEKWSRFFNLPLKQLVENYSTGMKKKLAFLATLSLDKPLIMLDEPFNGLDLESTQKIKHILKALKDQGKTLLVTSHILETLTANCDTISYLNNKKIELTLRKGQFHEIEDKIFRLHHQKDSRLIQELFGESSK